ncbi:MAG: hypothetical protein ACRDHW_08635, partial [Ktedonobacteraceae bacterium]
MRGKTWPIFLVLILVSWVIELGLGIVWLRLVWGTPWFRVFAIGKHTASLAAGIAQNIDALINNSGYYLTDKHRQQVNWTPGDVLTALIWLFVAVHVVNAVWFGFLKPFLRRKKLGARKLSGREREAFNKVFQQIASSTGEQIFPPRLIRSADGLGVQMRWIGNALIIDRELFRDNKKGRYFAPLLAHELGHSNSEDRLAHRLYAMLPRPASVVGTLGGFPFALGHVLLYPAWMWYWRQRIYAADSFAVKAGQGPALLKALDTLYLRMDKATAWGREWQPVPYVEERIDRISEQLSPVRV